LPTTAPTSRSTAETATESVTSAQGTTDTGAPFRVVPHSRMRRTIAARLSAAKQTVPHFYLSVECELDLLLDVRRRLNGEEGRISINDFVIRAAALALIEIPDANVSWTDDALHYYDRVDVAVAVATDGGLVTPVVRDAARKELADLSTEVRDLALRAREGKLAPAEYQGGSLTISNLGMYGIDSVYPILNPPQSCILGIGRASERPVAHDGTLGVATAMTCTLSGDHRALDGAVGARLLTAFKRRLEDPLEMLL
jgi:pyruvate dehydrogenase E2 component (dihydrolipoamide acetyltransferase)